MGISLLLGEKILSMLIACFVGFVIVKGKVLQTKDSKIISKLIAYVCSPCAIVSAFMVEITRERVMGVAITFAVAIGWHIVVISGIRLLGDKLDLNAVERASIIYSNAGYLVIPVVYSVLGAEWVLYTMGFTVTQTVLYWSHCTSLLCGTKKMDWKKILLNPNFIAMYLGVFIFLSGVGIPTFLESTVSDFGNMIGAISMFVIGMLIGEQDLKKMFLVKKIYLISFFRLLVIPVITVFVFMGIRKVISHSEIHNILMIVLWSACAPVGAMVTQLSQIYNLDSEYAGKINLVSVLFCIITMPMITYLYELLSF